MLTEEKVAVVERGGVYCDKEIVGAGGGCRDGV
jgi:hypothetical protein